jgi:hypothetical protein
VADILKGTLWWAANPTWTLVDNSISGATGTPLTAAGAHDANDATFAELVCPGDGVSLNGDANYYTNAALTACPAGGIKFVRLKVRARGVITGGAGSLQAYALLRLNGVNYGTPFVTTVLTGVYQNFVLDYTTDPSDGLPWTKSKVDGHTWGMDMRGVVSDPAFLTAAALRVAEYTVEVWGEDVTATVTGASTLAEGSTPLAIQGDKDGTAVVPLLMTLDGGSVPAVARSFKTGLNDQSTATKDTTSSAGPGTTLAPLYGAGSQGLVGSSGAGNGINGVGKIDGVRAYAIVRFARQGTGGAPVFTNMRFGTAMGFQALEADPTIYDSDLGLSESQYQVIRSVLITTGQFGQPFTWGNGVDSVWASFFGWTLNFTITGLGGTKQVDIAEAWVEILGPIGAGDSSNIELTMSLNLAPRIIKVQSTVL